MDFQQVRYFLELVETRNFTEAAKRSGVSQPALTQTIQCPEQELGGALLYRDGGDTRLTALGRDIRAEFASIDQSERRILPLSQNRVRGRRRTEQAVATGPGVCMLPAFSAIVSGSVVLPLQGLELARTISFQSISSREP